MKTVKILTKSGNVKEVRARIFTRISKKNIVSNHCRFITNEYKLNHITGIYE